MLKMKKEKRTMAFFAIALAICLIGSLGASLVQSSFGAVTVKNYNNRTVSEIIQEIEANNAAGNKNIAVSFTESATVRMTYKVLIPKSATPSNPAPAIVAMHGGLSNKDTYAPIFIDLARRGYVVIAFDAMGHGKTDKEVDELTHNTMGMEAMVELAMSMPCVDETKIGVTGHSWGNLGGAFVTNTINLETENPKVRAFLVNEGAGGVYVLNADAIAGIDFSFGLLCGKYSEPGGGLTVDSSPLAVNFIKGIYPAFNEEKVPMGVWFNEDGAHELAEGTRFEGSSRVFYRSDNTHPGALFSRSATAANINFFYGALGVPNGAKYISSTNQTWVWFMMFTVLGLAGWLMLALAIFELLLFTPMFRGLRVDKDLLVIDDKDALPAFKNWKESVPVLCMFVFLTIFSYVTMIPLTDRGQKLIPISKFFPNAAHTSSAFGYWSFIMAVVALIAIYIISQVKVFLNRNEESYNWENPLAPAKTPFGKVVQSALMAFMVFCSIHLILWCIDALFNVDFVIATIDFTTFRVEKVYVMLRYMLLCAPFYIVNAVLVANTRFKDVPEWASTAIVSVGNLLGLALILFREYSSLISTGMLVTPANCWTFTVAWAMLVPMALGPIIARYTYRRTGKIWVGALLNAFIFIMMQVGTGQYMNTSINITMFGL